MRHIAIIAPCLLVPLLAGGASAAEVERYRLEKSATGYVRMDTKTGEMSICEEKWGELVCKIAADERTAVQDEIERLQTDLKLFEERVATLKALEDRVAKLENSLTAKFERTLPTEEEFNKTMSYMERFFLGFIGIVRDLEGETADPATPGADKT